MDTLFFRDGKPFIMGEDTWANSQFLISPSIIYGALRTVYFAENIHELEKANKNDDPTRDLTINGIYFEIGNDIYLPLPLDCVKLKEDVKEESHNQAFTLSLTKNDNFLSSCPLEFILEPKKENQVENEPNGLIRISMFKKYLSHKVNSFSYKNINDYIISEPKIGIFIDKKTGTSKNQYLYRANMLRFSSKNGISVKIVVDFVNLNLPKNGLIKLGGEAKPCKYLINDGINMEFSLNFNNQSEKRFKLYFLTPAIFEKGWLPSWIDANSLIGNYCGLKLKLLTAAIGNPIEIGGFDIKKKKPKPMLRAVPSGSIYYFEILNDEISINDAFKQLNNKSISDIYPEQGFGIVFFGKI